MVAAEADAIKRLTGMRIAVPQAIALTGMRDADKCSFVDVTCRPCEVV
jgi:hypothetical protein